MKTVNTDWERYIEIRRRFDDGQSPTGPELQFLFEYAFNLRNDVDIEVNTRHFWRNKAEQLAMATAEKA